jgi:hypothetical protein
MRPVLLTVLLLASGCVTNDYEVIEWDTVDVFFQNPMEKVDILLVIDDSSSMDPHQEELGRHFQAFLATFVEADVDYHISAVTTDTFAEGAGVIQRPIIDADTARADEVFADMVAVGTEGNSHEMGLEAARLALTEPTLSESNAGFLRDDAALSLIFVSNEEDASWDPVAEYVNAFRRVKGQRERDRFNASALTPVDLDSCGEEQAALSTPSARYVDVALQTGGISGDLCAVDFEEVVVDLSLNASRLWDVFWLSASPDAGQLELTMNDQVIPCSVGWWTYDLREDEAGEPRPAIVFDREHIPPSGSHIVVRYYRGGGDPAAFCGQGDTL